ncbi:hypothetical protein DFH06DRAFT_1176614 [Mycena polygramma]|nr:hypothetical protein DFH06DRAFT_1176614 [Mycena polygramma]
MGQRLCLSCFFRNIAFFLPQITATVEFFRNQGRLIGEYEAVFADFLAQKMPLHGFFFPRRSAAAPLRLRPN